MPNTPQLHWMSTHVTMGDGAVLNAYIFEPPGADEQTPTVVMAHGWTLDHRSWDPVSRQLAGDGGARLVTYDQRGHGKSTLSEGKFRTGRESIKALGNDLTEILNAVVPKESPVVLAGHSMGGMTIMAFAGLHAEVLRDRVWSVVLAATSAGDLTGTGLPGEALAMRMASKVPFKAGALIRPSAQARTSFGDNPNPADIRAVCEQIRNTRLSTTGTFYGALTLHDEVAALTNLQRVPVQILVGSRDKLTSDRHARRLAQEIPSASLEIIEGAGHMLMYEATDSVVSAIRRGLATTELVDDYHV